jgi:RHS repeat-associated protein
MKNCSHSFNYLRIEKEQNLKSLPQIPSRSTENFCSHEGDYSFGFNGKELDKEGMGGGASTYDYGFRIYNSALAKFLSVDPLSASYPWYTPYQFAGNKPVWAIDLDGLEEFIRTDYIDSFGNLYRTVIQVVDDGAMVPNGQQLVHNCSVRVDAAGIATAQYDGSEWGSTEIGGLGSTLFDANIDNRIWNDQLLVPNTTIPGNPNVGSLNNVTEPSSDGIYSKQTFDWNIGGVGYSTDIPNTSNKVTNPNIAVPDPNLNGLVVIENGTIPNNEPWLPAGWQCVPPIDFRYTTDANPIGNPGTEFQYNGSLTKQSYSNAQVGVELATSAATEDMSGRNVTGLPSLNAVGSGSAQGASGTCGLIIVE